MTECNSTGSSRPVFGRLGRQAVDVDFKGGTITTDAGLLLLREVDRKLDLIRRIDKAIPDPRDQRYVTHKQREMLTSRIFGIAAGYEDGNDDPTHGEHDNVYDNGFYRGYCFLPLYVFCGD